MSQSIVIKSSVAILKLCAEEDIINKILNDQFLYSYIPSLEFVLETEQIEINAIVIVEKSESNQIHFDFPTVYYKFQNFDSKDLISLMEYVLERIRQEKGIICIHGAGSVYQDKLIVCWGNTTGMGKTTLALKLSENGGKFYSDEKVLIDLTLKKAVGRIKNQYVSNSYWKNRLGNVNYMEVDNLAQDIPYSIEMFIQPIICEQENYTLEKWDSQKFFWHLYEESSRKIRGISRTFFNGTYPVESLDTNEIAKKRLSLLKEFCEDLTGIYYKGKAEYIIDFIKKNN